MARPQSIGFHVPASTANLGPGYGVLAIALDLPLSITAVPRTDGEVHIERRDDPSAKEDPRHDPVLRGLRAAAELLDVSLSKGLDVVVEGTIPRGTGLGTISAGFAAGIGIAMRLSRQKDWSMHRLLDCLITLGGDPGHGAASLVGGLVATVPLSPPRERPHRHHLQRLALHPSWQFVVVQPDVAMGTAETKRVLPPTLPHAVTARTTGRTLGILSALADGDEKLLGECLFDEVHVPYRRSLVPGMEEAMTAGAAAGAAGATVCGHGPSLLAMTMHQDRCAGIAHAMIAAFAGSGRTATALQLHAAHYGALPVPPK